LGRIRGKETWGRRRTWWNIKEMSGVYRLLENIVAQKIKLKRNDMEANGEKKNQRERALGRMIRRYFVLSFLFWNLTIFLILKWI
jgi:hypothetical protein